MVCMEAGVKDRAEEILLRTIEEYINRGEPVSSRFLFKEYDFGIKPAMIRSELSRLEREGWLSQPHTSGGRIPTDKAYEFYAERLRGHLLKSTTALAPFSELAKKFITDNLEEFVEDFADEVHAFSVGFMVSGDSSARSGLDELFGRLDISEAGVFKSIARELEALDGKIEKCLLSGELEPSGLQVYIGEKSPFIKNEHLSTVFDTYDTGGDRLLLIAIQPKRSDYKKNFKAFLGLRKAIAEK